MIGLEALVEHLDQVEAVLVASGLDQESEWTKKTSATWSGDVFE